MLLGADTAGYREVFEGLDKAENILTKQRWIAGNAFTEADIRLFITLVRSGLSALNMPGHVHAPLSGLNLQGLIMSMRHTSRFGKTMAANSF